MKRVLAVGVACLLMAGALVVRNAITGDDEGDGDDGSGSDPGGDGDLVVACIPELEDACRALDRQVSDLRIEDPADTIGTAGDVDAWVTLDPWPAMAGVERLADREPVADDALVVLAQAGSVPAGCEDGLTWTCLVAELGDRVAVPDPGTATGRLVLGHAAIDLFGGPLASNDFVDPAFAEAMRTLDVGGDPLGDIRIGLPEPAATGALRLDLATLGNRPVQSGPGASPATVAVVVAGPQRDRVAGEPSFTEALAGLGWRVDPQSQTSGLPNAGVLVALTEEFG
jgi:hypothetical protein